MSRRVMVRRVPSVDAITAAIQALSSGEWYEISPASNGLLSDVAYSGAVNVTGGIATLIGAWGSGCYDSSRKRLMVGPGGGRGNYSGNEVYAYSFQAPYGWSRLTDPSQFPGNDPAGFDGDAAGAPWTHSDGAPITRHQYGQIQYVPSLDKMLVVGGFGIFGTTAAQIDQQSRLFDPSNGTWADTDTIPAGSVGGAYLSAVVDGVAYAQPLNGGSDRTFLRFNNGTELWTQHGGHSIGSLGEPGMAEAVPAADDHGAVNAFYLLYTNGTAQFFRKDLSAFTALAAQSTTGTALSTFDSAKGPGFAYCPTNGLIYAWIGGQTLYTFDCSQDPVVIATVSGTGANPGAVGTEGTYGRFRWVPHLGVFCVVNSVTTNMFVVKP